MSQQCSILDCKRTARALCHCCQQNLCRDHFNEHADALTEQLNPFTDEINQLNDRLNHINVENLIGNFQQQLIYWRNDAHQRIDQYFDIKQRELNHFIEKKIHKQIEKINSLKSLISQLIQKEDTTMEDLNIISSTIQNLRREITQIEYKSIDISINPLEIDEKLIQIEDENMKKDFNLSTLMPPLRTIGREAECPKPLATNNRVLLMHYSNQLCLLDKDLNTLNTCPWPHGWVWDMCWSSTISKFFIVTLSEIFILDENNMSLERVMTKEKYTYSSCTCSDTSLYITTNELASTICEFSLVPSIELTNRWQPSDLCQINEIIQDIVYHKGTLAFIIENQTSHTKRMELRLTQTFEHIWSIQFDTIDPLHNAYRLCLFNYNEWIVIDWKTSKLIYVTNDGQIKSTFIYESVPYRCCQFGSNMLAISSRNSVNFHKI